VRAISMQSETGAAHGHSTSTPVKTKPGPVRTCLCYKRRVAGVTELESSAGPGGVRRGGGGSGAGASRLQGHLRSHLRAAGLAVCGGGGLRADWHV
jgi:hypothetical protein